MDLASPEERSLLGEPSKSLASQIAAERRADFTCGKPALVIETIPATGRQVWSNEKVPLCAGCWMKLRGEA